jgi:hypothetical protein
MVASPQFRIECQSFPGIKNLQGGGACSLQMQPLQGLQCLTSSMAAAYSQTRTKKR